MMISQQRQRRSQMVLLSIVGALAGLPGPARASTEQGSSSDAMPAVVPTSAPASAPTSAPACTPALPPVCPPACPKVVAAAPKLSGWNLEFTPYLWVAGLRGEVGVGFGEDVLARPIDASFSDLSKSLKIGVMGSVRFRYRRFAIMAEANYIAFGRKATLSEVTGSELNVDIRTVFGTAHLSYGFEPLPGVTLNPYLGARWWWIEAGAQIDGGLLDGREFEVGRAWADPVAGLFIRNDINDNWFVEFTGDVGGGVSIVSWQLYGAVGYNFARWFGLFAGYRLLGVHYDRDGFLFKLTTQGLLAGLRFTI